jgi:hypothetical protein
MKNTLIAQALIQYQHIARLSADIEQALQVRDIDTLSALCETMNGLQDAVQASDSALLDLLRNRRDLRESAEMLELLAIMEQIKVRNQRLTPQINGIMAVQRNELQQLNKGNTLLQGYRTTSPQTGRRISSTG